MKLELQSAWSKSFLLLAALLLLTRALASSTRNRPATVYSRSSSAVNNYRGSNSPGSRHRYTHSLGIRVRTQQNRLTRQRYGPNFCGSVCCRGWMMSKSGYCILPICSPKCKNRGLCVQPNKCKCQVGFRGRTCTFKVYRASSSLAARKKRTRGTRQALVRVYSRPRIVSTSRISLSRPRLISRSCSGVVCLHGGSCVRGTCICSPYYTGSHCESPKSRLSHRTVSSRSHLSTGLSLNICRSLCDKGRCMLKTNGLAICVCHSNYRGTFCNIKSERPTPTRHFSTQSVTDVGDSSESSHGEHSEMQLGKCYRGFQGDACALAFGGTFTAEACCRILGEAWGPSCTLCSTIRTRSQDKATNVRCARGYRSENDKCHDINECAEGPSRCVNGRCVNNRGSYWCRCNAGFHLDSSRTACLPNTVVQNNFDECFISVSEAGQCSTTITIRGDSKAVCCCSIGVAWGRNCELCPTDGSDEKRRLCPFGAGYSRVPTGSKNVINRNPHVSNNSDEQLDKYPTESGTTIVRMEEETWRPDNDDYTVTTTDSPLHTGMSSAIAEDHKETTSVLNSKKTVATKTGATLVTTQNPISTVSDTFFVQNSVRLTESPNETTTSYLLTSNSPKTMTSKGRSTTSTTSDSIFKTTNVPSTTRSAEDKATSKPSTYVFTRKTSISATKVSKSTKSLVEATTQGATIRSFLITLSSATTTATIPITSTSSSVATTVKKETTFISPTITISTTVPLATTATTTKPSATTSAALPETTATSTTTPKITPTTETSTTLHKIAPSTSSTSHSTKTSTPATSHSTTTSTPATSHSTTTSTPATSHSTTTLTSSTSHSTTTSTSSTSHSTTTSTPATSHSTTTSRVQTTTLPITTNSTEISTAPVLTTTLSSTKAVVLKTNGHTVKNITLADTTERSKTMVIQSFLTDACHPLPCLNGGTCSISQTNSLSFVCSCLPGFRGSICEEANDLDSCSSGPCENGAICKVGSGYYSCICRPGYGGIRCEIDINECMSDPCGHGTCRDGVNQFFCACEPGYAGVTCASDINECEIISNICGPDAECRNTVGSYHCEAVTKCNSGYEPTTGDGKCQDINECADSMLCKGGRCSNTRGSFYCSCPIGYNISADNRNCLDLDECLSERCGGESRCRNYPGGYECECMNPHEYYDAARRSCVGSMLPTDNMMPNPMTPLQNEPISQLKPCFSDQNVCQNSLVSNITERECCCTMGKAWGTCNSCPYVGSAPYRLLCPHGHGLIPEMDSFNVLDIDECQLFGSEKICPNGLCRNSYGAFMCICYRGFYYDRRRQACQDFNECLIRNKCVGGKCINQIGSFRCVCPPHHILTLERMGARCVRISQPPRPLPVSTTTTQSTTTTRRTTTIPETTTSTSTVVVPEVPVVLTEPCFARSTRQFMCFAQFSRNMTYKDCCCSAGKAWGVKCSVCPGQGSNDFNDLCRTDQYLAESTLAHRNVNRPKCGLEGGCANGVCIRLHRGFTCRCNKGYRLNERTTTCEDINECEERRSIFRPCIGGRCNNTQGSFRCRCFRGLRPSPSNPTLCVRPPSPNSDYINDPPNL